MTQDHGGRKRLGVLAQGLLVLADQLADRAVFAVQPGELAQGRFVAGIALEDSLVAGDDFAIEGIAFDRPVVLGKDRLGGRDGKGETRGQSDRKRKTHEKTHSGQLPLPSGRSIEMQSIEKCSEFSIVEEGAEV